MKTLFLLLTAAVSVHAAGTKLEYFNTAGTELRDIDGAPLTDGAIRSRDGAVLQLGYYDMATGETPFLGNWVALTGEGSHNVNRVASIGDGFDGPGRFDISTFFVEGSPMAGNDLPRIGTPLAIRFYDGTSLATALHFNAVSSPKWDWRPIDGHMFIGLNDPGLTWQGGAASAFRTTEAVPEPSTLMLLLAAVTAVGRRRGLKVTRRAPPIQRRVAENGRQARVLTKANL
jgi:hypothetical protein